MLCELPTGVHYTVYCDLLPCVQVTCLFIKAKYSTVADSPTVEQQTPNKLKMTNTTVAEQADGWAAYRCVGSVHQSAM